MISQELDNEAGLLRLLAGGDAAAFRQVFHHYNALLLPFVLKLTGSPDAAQEIIQEIFLAVWQQRDKLAGHPHPRAWMYRVASNKAISYLRGQAARGRLFDRLSTGAHASPIMPDDALQARQTAALIDQAVRSLTPAQQQVYRLSREQNLSIAEIADRQGVSPNTIKNQLVAALKSVKGFLEKGLYALAFLCFIFS